MLLPLGKKQLLYTTVGLSPAVSTGGVFYFTSKPVPTPDRGPIILKEEDTEVIYPIRVIKVNGKYEYRQPRSELEDFEALEREIFPNRNYLNNRAMKYGGGLAWYGWIKVQGDQGYDPQKSLNAWKEVTSRYSKPEHRLISSLGHWLTEENRRNRLGWLESSDWSRELTMKDVMQSCARMWGDNSSLYLIKYKAARGWCVDVVN